MKLPPLLRAALSQWPGFVVALIPSIGLVVLFSVMAAIGLPDQGPPDCVSQVTSLMKSPEAPPGPVHIALARDESCVVTGLGGGSWQVQCVHLVGEGTSAAQKNEVFCIQDYTPGPRVALRWRSPQDLEITAPNLSIVATRKARFDGVGIEVKFDPDDPVARKTWLQSQGRTDK
jgi:hypothetical protein